ncbi:polysaccharide lyase family 14 protein, partial [Mycena leptocephala]
DTFQSGFTACPSLMLPEIQPVTSRTNHPLVVPPAPAASDADWPAPSLAWEAFYPKGSINPSAPIPGGFGFYLSGPPAYRMMLQVTGIGGDGDFSYACTGGRQDNRCKCFNVRPMWRSKGLGELYTYLPLTPTNRERLIAVPPSSKENSDYGFSVGRNAFQFDVAVGKWVSLAFRVKLNTIGSDDGELELWVAGLTLRDSERSLIKGAHFQTFFGGHQDDWASPKDQRAWFADLSGVVIE